MHKLLIICASVLALSACTSTQKAATVGGVAGALIGGVAGAAVEEGVTAGSAIEFVVRTDEGRDITVVQTNEAGLQVGERVSIIRGDRTRLARAAGAPVTRGAYAPK